MSIKNKTYGVLAEFKSPSSLYNVVKVLKKIGYEKIDTFSPFPIHSMDKAMRLKDSYIGYIVAVGALLGFSLGFGLQTWASVEAYPMIISGKKLFSWQAFIPITFELTILLSAFAAVFGMFFLNKLPKYHSPLFEIEDFKGVTSHRFFLLIEEEDPLFQKKKTKKLLEENGSIKIHDIPLN